MRELQRFENWVGGKANPAVFERSCASMRATRRFEVIGFEPVVYGISHKAQLDRIQLLDTYGEQSKD